MSTVYKQKNIIIATSKEKSNDNLINLLKKEFKIFRGSEKNVRENNLMLF